MDFDTILNVENLSVYINKELILKDLTFSVKKWDTLIILGPNGAGKTTLLKALLGLIESQGKVEWASKKISYLPPKELFARKDLPPLSIQDFFNLKKLIKKKFYLF